MKNFALKILNAVVFSYIISFLMPQMGKVVINKAVIEGDFAHKYCVLGKLAVGAITVQIVLTCPHVKGHNSN